MSNTINISVAAQTLGAIDRTLTNLELVWAGVRAIESGQLPKPSVRHAREGRGDAEEIRFTRTDRTEPLQVLTIQEVRNRLSEDEMVLLLSTERSMQNKIKAWDRESKKIGNPADANVEAKVRLLRIASGMKDDLNSIFSAIERTLNGELQDHYGGERWIAANAESMLHQLELEQAATSLGPTPSFKMALFYAVISFAALVIAGVAAWFIVVHLDTLARYMATEKAYFVLLVVVGLGSGGFLFGAMRSIGSISGNRFGMAFEFGGPAALAVFLIVLGMELPSSVKPFDLTVRFAGMQQVTPGDKAEIDLGVRREVLDIGPFGEIVIRGVDPKVMSQTINIGLISKSWRIKNPEKDYAIPSDALIRIETIPVGSPAPQSR